MEGVFPLDPLDEGQVRPFGGVGDIGVFLVLVEDELPDVVEGKPEAGVEPPRLFQPPFDQFGVHELPDERRRQQADPGGDDLLFHLPADRLGGLLVDPRLADQGLDDAPAVPAGDLLAGGPDKERDIGGFRIGRHHRIQMLVLDAPSTAAEDALRRPGEELVVVVVQGKDPEMDDPGRDEAVDLPEGFGRGGPRRGIEDVDPLFRLRHGIDRPRVLRRQIDAEGHVLQRAGQAGADLFLIVAARGEAGPPLDLVDGDLRRKGHLPLDLPVVELFPFPPEFLFPRIRAVAPRPDLGEETPLVAVQIRIQSLGGIRGQDQVHRLPEDLLEVEVERPGRPVEIDVGIEVQPRIQKAAEGRDARLVEREAVLREEGVEAQPRDVDDVEGKAGHEGVALDIIEVVHGIDAGEELPEELEPPGHRFVALVRHLDQEGHRRRVERLARGKGSRGAPPDPGDHPPQLPDDDQPAQILMGEPVLVQEMVVEEVAVGAVADVVEETRHPEQLLHAVRGGDVRDRPP